MTPQVDRILDRLTELLSEGVPIASGRPVGWRVSTDVSDALLAHMRTVLVVERRSDDRLLRLSGYPVRVDPDLPPNSILFEPDGLELVQ